MKQREQTQPFDPHINFIKIVAETFMKKENLILQGKQLLISLIIISLIVVFKL